jgi:triacylglycerol lipase
MNRIAKVLNSEGYIVVNVDYPSRKYSIEELAENFLAKNINEVCTDKKKKIHFVTHSLGGIVVRQFIDNHGNLNIGRVVMIVPPNQGSEIADLLRDNFLLKACFGPVLQQLRTNKDSFVKTKLNHPINYELGIIAGDSYINPLFNFILEKPHDGMLPVDSTKIEGMKEHIVISSSHVFIIFNQMCIRLVSNFLKYGSFTKPSLK